jgi:hypothetical protein
MTRAGTESLHAIHDSDTIDQIRTKISHLIDVLEASKMVVVWNTIILGIRFGEAFHHWKKNLKDVMTVYEFYDQLGINKATYSPNMIRRLRSLARLADTRPVRCQSTPPVHSVCVGYVCPLRVCRLRGRPRVRRRSCSTTLRRSSSIWTALPTRLTP